MDCSQISLDTNQLIVETSMKTLGKYHLGRNLRGMEFHRKLADLVASSPHSQNEIARQTGIDQGQLSKLATGKAPNVTRAQLVALARHFGVSVDWLADDSLDVQPADPANNPIIRRAVEVLGIEEVERRLFSPPIPALGPPPIRATWHEEPPAPSALPAPGKRPESGHTA